MLLALQFIVLIQVRQSECSGWAHNASHAAGRILRAGRAKLYEHQARIQTSIFYLPMMLKMPEGDVEAL